jgi:chemotaxis protein MotB
MGQGDNPGGGAWQPYAQSNSDNRARQRAALGYLPWGVLGLVLVGFGVFYGVEHQPAMAERDEARQQLGGRDRALSEAKGSLETTRKALDELQAKRDELAKQLEQAEQKRKEAEEALSRLRSELGTALEAEIASGDVLLRTEEGRIVVDVADKLLFDTGEVEISEGGKKLLLHVAATLRRLTKHTFQVAGHTDSARVVSPELKERYPTNWELSTARATNVVRFLQDRGKVPGKRLVASGYAQYRPAASNQSEKERAKNRRIEITLLQNP